jgi:hypothetical protein
MGAWRGIILRDTQKPDQQTSSLFTVSPGYVSGNTAIASWTGNGHILFTNTPSGGSVADFYRTRHVPAP